ncbi:hypothetical protein [Salinarimonas ramus]|uniref:Uncharacterized protein n=1 Tax=Salinarimonas ramus TaxID=690164 RepID=A0A917V390_9HYPH|nr:hypothetical protein [Salinarimonas ramus]GGK30119.1 hypothetical protein GCM10011322_15780 [Salinarimonas ramus]
MAPSTPEISKAELLKALREAAGEAQARERVAAHTPDVGDEATLADAWRRADDAARAILSEDAHESEACRARYEARLWLDGSLPGPGAGTTPGLPQPVPGSLAGVSAAGLVSAVDTIEGLAEITRTAIGVGDLVRQAEERLAARDPQAACALRLLAELMDAIAAASVERLDAREPATRDAARRRASALVCQALARGDARALERAGMIAMRAGLELFELE